MKAMALISPTFMEANPLTTFTRFTLFSMAWDDRRDRTGRAGTDGVFAFFFPKQAGK